LSLVTAAIATSWVETEERRVEREIMRDMRREVATVRDELAALRRDLNLRRNADHEQASHAPAPRDGRSKRKPV
jgi:voltage-gated potassium channel